MNGIMSCARILSFTMMVFGLGSPVPMDGVTPEPGIFYHTTGVARNDQLNIRSEPGADAAIVGMLRFDEANIAITGTQQVTGSTTWWEIIHSGLNQDTGWVNGKFLAPDSFSSEGMPALPPPGALPPPSRPTIWCPTWQGRKCCAPCIM
jgi:hypothetical protein